MITSSISTPPERHEPKEPFLWQSEGGCVYLRNEAGIDIIIAPRINDGKIGRVCTSQTMDRHKAWKRRLPPLTIVTMNNTTEYGDAS